MSDDDLIRRMDAIRACQVGPSDEWSKSTKDGYNQAATDCAMNILRIPTSTDLADALAVPEIAALVKAVRRFEMLMQTQIRTADFHGGGCGCIRCAEDDMFAALRAIGEPRNG